MSQCPQTKTRYSQRRISWIAMHGFSKGLVATSSRIVTMQYLWIVVEVEHFHFITHYEGGVGIYGIGWSRVKHILWLCQMFPPSVLETHVSMAVIWWELFLNLVDSRKYHDINWRRLEQSSAMRPYSFLYFHPPCTLWRKDSIPSCTNVPPPLSMQWRHLGLRRNWFPRCLHWNPCLGSLESPSINILKQEYSNASF